MLQGGKIDSERRAGTWQASRPPSSIPAHIMSSLMSSFTLSAIAWYRRLHSRLSTTGTTTCCTTFDTTPAVYRRPHAVNGWVTNAGSRPVNCYLYNHGYNTFIPNGFVRLSSYGTAIARIRCTRHILTRKNGWTLFLHGCCLVAQMSMRTRTTFPLSKQWSCELGLGFFLHAARVHIHHIYIHATCKRYVEKGLT